MIAVERTVRTDRPVDQVFGYLSDFTNAEEWDAGTVRCTLVRGDGGPGTEYHNVSRFLGRDTELTYTVREVDSPRRYVVVGANSTVTSTDTITVAADSDGTAVSYRAEFEFHGFARFLEPLLRLPVKQLADDAEQTLQAALTRL
jgi:hypothetical protein